MAALPTLYPTGTNAAGTWTDESGGTTDLHLLIDETGAAGTDYIRTPTSGGPHAIELEVTDMPADFATLNSLQIELRHSRGSVEGGSAGAGDDTFTVQASIQSSGGTWLAGNSSTPLDRQQISTGTTGYAPTTSTVSFGYVNLTADKTAWDSARLTIRVVFTANMGNDGHRVWVDYVRLVNGDYDTGTPPPNSGSATGSITWAGTATGTSVHSGASTGTIDWVGSATGTSVHSGASTGTIDWVGSATGEMPAEVSDGSATGTIDWTGSATGTHTSSGSASGAITWTGTADGATGHSGASSGTISWAGSATGSAGHQGASTGTITWAGSATGEAPAVGVNDGSASGSITWVGTADGTAIHSGASTGTITWSGSATGEMPTVDTQEGSATGSITWAGAASGTTTRSGAASGSLVWSGVANGITDYAGEVTGSITWAGVATGEQPSQFYYWMESGLGVVSSLSGGGGVTNVEGG